MILGDVGDWEYELLLHEITWELLAMWYVAWNSPVNRIQKHTLSLGKITGGENISPGGPYLSLLFASRVLHVFPRSDQVVQSLIALAPSQLSEPL